MPKTENKATSSVASQPARRYSRAKLKYELARSILLDPQERDFWLQNLTTLPLPVVKNLLKILAPRNQQVDSYMETALAQDKNQEHLQALRQQVAQIKKTAMKLEEKGAIKGEKKQEEELLQQLENID